MVLASKILPFSTYFSLFFIWLEIELAFFAVPVMLLGKPIALYLKKKMCPDGRMMTIDGNKSFKQSSVSGQTFDSKKEKTSQKS